MWGRVRDQKDLRRSSAVALTALLIAIAPGARGLESGPYLPLVPGTTWDYQLLPGSEIVQARVEGTTPVNGIITTRIDNAAGDLLYFTNDSNGIRLHRVDTAVPAAFVTMSPPILLAAAETFIGARYDTTGEAEFDVPGAGVFPFTYTSSSRILAEEVIEVPAGIFETVRVEWTLELSGTINGTPISEQATETFWLAPNVGIVRDDLGGGEVLELVDSSLLTAETVLVSAVLPGSRAATVGTTATAFATLINAGPGDGTACTIAPVTQVSADFFFQTTDPLTNELVGQENAPVDLASGQSQSFAIGFTPFAAFPGVDVELRFGCVDTPDAASIPGVNTLLLSASTAPTPDVVALSATLTGDGIVTVQDGAGAFSVATINIGASDLITVTADTGAALLPVSLAICETDPATSQCVNPTVPTVDPLTLTMDSNATPTFAVFVAAESSIPLDPAVNRIFVRFRDSSGNVVGATSVAVQTLP